MRFILLAIFVLIASQPVQVSACDMHDAPQSAQHGSHDMDHGGGQKMDCCDHDPGMPSDHCNPAFHCNAHSMGAMAFDAISLSVVYIQGDRLDWPDSSPPLSNFTPPPFKPPIV